jgi:RimJ/RimL family protein N-acetyltransferase
MVIPELHTERLQMRGPTHEDFSDSASMWGNPEVTLHIGGKPSTHEESWWRLLRNIGHWAVMGFGYWVVREKATGRFVGEVGLADLQRTIEPSFAGAPEMGWVLAPSAHGKGYATEAVQAALGWARTRFGAEQRLVCLIDPGNTASLRVAEKAGFVEHARTLYHGEPVIQLERRGSLAG